MRKAAVVVLLSALVLAALPAHAGPVSIQSSIYVEGGEDKTELVASRTVDWEVRESVHVTVSADVIYRYEAPVDLHRLATGLDVSGTCYVGKMSLTVGGRIRSDQTPRWYFLMTVYH